MARSRQSSAPATLPLPTLLSHALVAFTIEFDNEFEHQMPHRTTKHGVTAKTSYAPWLGSLVLWSTCMQFVGEQGVSVREMERLARTGTNLNGMQRWGYISIAPDPADKRPKPPRSDWIIRARPGGRKAQEVWRPLFGVIEKRWQERFGNSAIGELRESLGVLVRQMDVALPDCLPILGYGLFSKGQERVREANAQAEYSLDPSLPLSALLSRVLLTFAVEFEQKSYVSLAIHANVLRLLDEKGVPVRDLPILSGVSKESISMAMGILEKLQIAVIEPDPMGSRAKVARLTPRGIIAQEYCLQRLREIEERWQAHFGESTIAALRASLERLVGEPTVEMSPLFLGLEPYPDGWRASVRKPRTLPHYPMVLHRGGYPDGS
jgi:DNA-binding MarR family transcriptional regulator